MHFTVHALQVNLQSFVGPLTTPRRCEDLYAEAFVHESQAYMRQRKLHLQSTIIYADREYTAHCRAQVYTSSIPYIELG